MLLHGDNGSGKTTILKLLWNLLSTAELKGHKSAIARTPFKKFKVEFEDGRKVEARRPESLVGSFDLAVSGGGLTEELVATFLVDDEMDVGPTPGYGTAANELSFSWEFLQDGVVRRVRRRRDGGGAAQADDEAPPMRRVMAFLKDLSVQPALLGDDRQLHSDAESETDSERDESTPSERVAEELRQALTRVNRVLRSKTIRAQRLGSSEEASIYSNVLRRIRNYGSHSEPGDRNFDRVEKAIDELAKLVPDFAEFELITDFDPEDIRQSVRNVGTDNRAIADAIILPYLESMKARFAALTDAERILRLLTTHANRYLRDKRLVYSPQSGLRVVTSEATPRTLRPANLSSGERQMLLLLCNALLAGIDRTLFLIDEPELSLGVLWQRQILSSLLDLTEGTDVQFIVATHSIEMITANASALVRLGNKVG